MYAIIVTMNIDPVTGIAMVVSVILFLLGVDKLLKIRRRK